MRTRSIFAAVIAAGFAATSVSPAFALTTHKRVHRHAPMEGVMQTSAQRAPIMMVPTDPYYGGAYYPGPAWDDPAFDSPWDPTFGWGRQPDVSGIGGG